VNLPEPSWQLDNFQIRDIAPDSKGCLCILVGVTPGAPVVAAGNVPPKLIGAKWCDVYSHVVILWRDGEAFLTLLKSELPGPPTLESVIDHQRRHPQVWKSLSVTRSAA
jgi:hypothetical protein